MHILIIPSEIYINKKTLGGIFQRDQAVILKSKGHKIGIISVSMKYSFFMLLKGFIFKIIQKKINNSLNEKSTIFILKTIIKKTVFLKKYIYNDKLDEIPVFRIESYYGLFLSDKFKYKGWMRGGLVVFKKYVSKHGMPEIIHAHNMVYAGLLAVILKNKYKIPIVVTEHSSLYSQNLISLRILNKINNSFKNIDKFCVVSNSLGNILKTKLTNLKNYHCVPNVLDNSFIATQRENNKNSNIFTFINVASFIPIKGQENLIKAFALKFKNKGNIKLKIIGGGVLKDNLIELVKKEGVENQISIIEKLSRLEIIKHLDTSDIFVFSSISETFGVVVIEALSRGIPIVSTKCGGPESIINKDNGILVNNTINDIGEGMLCLKENILKYKTETIRKDCLKKYSGESFYRNIIPIYNIVNNKM